MKQLYTAPLCLTFHHFAAPPFQWNHMHNTAPNLPMSTLCFIRDMIQSDSLTTSQMADAAECSEKTIKKGFIRRNWCYYAEDPDREFASFLKRCINQVGAKKNSARGHFRHAGLSVENLDD
jgi:hypothetical protein